MSLILEALKKLEREKETGERGLVVLSHLPWVGARTGRAGLVAASVAVLALVLLVLGGAGIWQWRRGAGANPTADAPLSGSASSMAPAAPSAPPIGPGTGASVLTPISPIAPPVARTGTRSVAARPELSGTLLPFPVAAPTPLSDPPVVPAGPSDPGHGPTPAKSGEIHLNAISVRDGHPVAILNDRLVREGDSFDGIHVLRIGEAEVEVEVGGVRRILTF
jgi:hypothetical protein